MKYDNTKKIVDFELIQSLILNLGHSNRKIFNETMDVLSSLNIVEDEVYMKVMFTMEGIQNLIEIFPNLNDSAKISFCLAVLFQFTHDPKTAGTVMLKGGEPLYKALVKMIKVKFI